MKVMRRHGRAGDGGVSGVRYSRLKCKILSMYFCLTFSIWRCKVCLSAYTLKTINLPFFQNLSTYTSNTCYVLLPSSRFNCGGLTLKLSLKSSRMHSSKFKWRILLPYFQVEGVRYSLTPLKLCLPRYCCKL